MAVDEWLLRRDVVVAADATGVVAVVVTIELVRVVRLRHCPDTRKPTTMNRNFGKLLLVAYALWSVRPVVSTVEPMETMLAEPLPVVSDGLDSFVERSLVRSDLLRTDLALHVRPDDWDRMDFPIHR